MNITINYGSQNGTFTFDAGTTIDTVLNSPTVRGELGYGTSVEAHLDGVPQLGHLQVREGDALSIYDRQCSKAAANESGLAEDVASINISANGGVVVSIAYGSGEVVTREFAEGTTMQQALEHKEVRGALGYGASVEGHIDGVPQKPETKLVAGDEVKVYDRQCSKASAK